MRAILLGMVLVLACLPAVASAQVWLNGYYIPPQCYGVPYMQQMQAQQRMMWQRQMWLQQQAAMQQPYYQLEQVVRPGEDTGMMVDQARLQQAFQQGHETLRRNMDNNGSWRFERDAFGTLRGRGPNGQRMTLEPQMGGDFKVRQSREWGH